MLEVKKSGLMQAFHILLELFDVDTIAGMLLREGGFCHAAVQLAVPVVLEVALLGSGARLQRRLWFAIQRRILHASFACATQPANSSE